MFGRARVRQVYRCLIILLSIFCRTPSVALARNGFVVSSVCRVAAETSCTMRVTRFGYGRGARKYASMVLKKQMIRRK